MTFYGQNREIVISPDKLDKVIRPGMRGYASTQKTLSILCFVGIFVFFFGFGLAAFALVGSGRFHPSVIFLIMAGFITCGVLAGVFASRSAHANAVVHLMDKVEQCEKISIRTLCPQNCSESDTVYLVKRLIDTGNLPNHVLWEDRLVAKRGLEITPEDLGYVTVSQPKKLGKCPNCGANMTENGCEYCGYRA